MMSRTRRRMTARVKPRVAMTSLSFNFMLITEEHGASVRAALSSTQSMMFIFSSPTVVT